MEINKIYNEPCLETLRKMPNEFLDSVITSPPYWQLRDYGYPEQWGLEPTFQEYLEHLWEMMDEIYRVLKPSGTVWINLGDTFSGSGAGHKDTGKGSYDADNFRKQTTKIKNIPNKCLLLIPHRFAIGCIDRGWIVRNDIIWAKRNGMPESITDRFSKKHEYFFFMVKSQKYYFDLDSVRDKHIWADKDKRADGKRHESKGLTSTGIYSTNAVCFNNKGKNPGSVSDFWDIPTKSNTESHYAQYSDNLIKKPILAGCPENGLIYDPFMGSGSTAESSFRANRNFIGSEMSVDYFNICQKRISKLLNQQRLF
jgi:DNA modification methylase